MINTIRAWWKRITCYPHDFTFLSINNYNDISYGDCVASYRYTAVCMSCGKHVTKDVYGGGSLDKNSLIVLKLALNRGTFPSK